MGVCAMLLLMVMLLLLLFVQFEHGERERSGVAGDGA